MLRGLCRLYPSGECPKAEPCPVTPDQTNVEGTYVFIGNPGPGFRAQSSALKIACGGEESCETYRPQSRRQPRRRALSVHAAPVPLHRHRDRLGQQVCEPAASKNQEQCEIPTVSFPSPLSLPGAGVLAGWPWMSRSTHFPLRPMSLFEQRVDKLVGIKRQHVPSLFSNTDIPYRQPQFAGNGDHHSTLGRSIQLGENDPGHTCRLGK